MPNVRKAPTRRWVDTTNLWPRAEEYATTHGLPSVSDVIRLALEQLLDRPGLVVAEATMSLDRPPFVRITRRDGTPFITGEVHPARD